MGARAFKPLMLIVMALGLLWAIFAVLVSVRTGPFGQVQRDGASTPPSSPTEGSPADTPDGGASFDRGASYDGPRVELRVRSPLAAPALSSDSAGPLFVEANLAPGYTSSRCVSVSNLGQQLADVRMYGHVEDGGLARHVILTVEAGQGGGWSDCSNFRGRQIFEGSLFQLADEHRDFDTGVRAADRVMPDDAVSFRLTQRLASTASQGLAAKARFEWEARGQGAPDVVTDESFSYQQREMSPIVNDQTPEDEPSLAKRLLEVSVEVAQRGWSWLVLLLLVIAFIVVQDRIDRRDPRLVRARIQAEPDLDFEEPTDHHREQEAT